MYMYMYMYIYIYIYIYIHIKIIWLANYDVGNLRLARRCQGNQTLDPSLSGFSQHQFIELVGCPSLIQV